MGTHTGDSPLGFTLLIGKKEFELTRILPQEPSVIVKRLCKLSLNAEQMLQLDLSRPALCCHTLSSSYALCSSLPLWKVRFRVQRSIQSPTASTPRPSDSAHVAFLTPQPCQSCEDDRPLWKYWDPSDSSNTKLCTKETREGDQGTLGSTY